GEPDQNVSPNPPWQSRGHRAPICTRGGLAACSAFRRSRARCRAGLPDTLPRRDCDSWAALQRSLGSIRTSEGRWATVAKGSSRFQTSLRASEPGPVMIPATKGGSFLVKNVLWAWPLRPAGWLCRLAIDRPGKTFVLALPVLSVLAVTALAW